MFKAADLSACGTYRYSLRRQWLTRPAMAWIMLNPSTADANIDDPTIRRCIGFAQAWGYGGIEVFNLFALRATNPKALLAHSDPVGPDNAAWLERLYRARLVVAAWGAHAAAARMLDTIARADIPHADGVHRVISELGDVKCLGTTKYGAPRHPLYVRADAELQPWATEVAA